MQGEWKAVDGKIEEAQAAEYQSQIRKFGKVANAEAHKLIDQIAHPEDR